MDKYKKYYGLAILVVVFATLITTSVKIIAPKYEELSNTKNSIVSKQKKLDEKKEKKQIVESKLKQKRDSVSKCQKKIYSPIDSDLGKDSLFFTLYNDVIDMIHTNNVRIKSMDYVYNPESDMFVKHRKDLYFVSDINLELVSNFVNLGKLIQNIYQYPYYIKINKIKVTPFAKDKKILLTSMSLRLYAYTEPNSGEEVIKSRKVVDTTEKATTEKSKATKSKTSKSKKK